MPREEVVHVAPAVAELHPLLEELDQEGPEAFHADLEAFHQEAFRGVQLKERRGDPLVQDS